MAYYLIDLILFRNSDVSFDSQALIKGLLQLKADRRLTATQVRQKLELIIAGKPSSINVDQLVPALPGDVPKCNKPKSTVKVSYYSFNCVRFFVKQIYIHRKF